MSPNKKNEANIFVVLPFLRLMVDSEVNNRGYASCKPLQIAPLH